jgi:hypothetical protein
MIVQHPVNKLVQYELLNMITLGNSLTENINQMITTSIYSTLAKSLTVSYLVPGQFGSI